MELTPAAVKSTSATCLHHPVGGLALLACCDELALVCAVAGVRNAAACCQYAPALEGEQVPQDAGAIAAGCDCLPVAQRQRYAVYLPLQTLCSTSGLQMEP